MKAASTMSRIHPKFHSAVAAVCGAAALSGTTLAETGETVIVVSAGGRRFAAIVEDSATGRAFLEKLPLTLDMSELNGNEKYRYGVTLPTASEYCDTIAPGDLMLYSSNCLVLFYGAAGGYSYTRVGKLVSTDGLAEALGTGTATVTFEKAELKAAVSMTNDVPTVTAITNLPADTAITTLAAEHLDADKSDWTDWDALDDEAKSRRRFFKLVAHLTTP